MTADAKLLPCPFCGSDDVDRHFALTDAPKRKYDPGCMKCGACAPTEVWNSRVPYVPTPPLTTPPTEGDEKRLRKMTKHEAIHELEGQCCVIARACCSLTNLDALTLAGFDIPETEGIMKLAEAVIERARVLHDAEFISKSE